MKKIVEYTVHFDAVMAAMSSRGLLMGCYDASGRANLMTIGWGSVGVMWGVPVWTVLVRPSRHTYACVEHSGCFTVNVPPASLAAACAVCGTKSGRDIDKFAACGLTLERAHHVAAPVVAECPLVYECLVVHVNDILPSKLTDDIRRNAYPGGDFHRVYYGKILRVSATPDAEKLLMGKTERV